MIHLHQEAPVTVKCLGVFLGWELVWCNAQKKNEVGVMFTNLAMNCVFGETKSDQKPWLFPSCPMDIEVCKFSLQPIHWDVLRVSSPRGERFGQALKRRKKKPISLVGVENEMKWLEICGIVRFVWNLFGKLTPEKSTALNWKNGCSMMLCSVAALRVTCPFRDQPKSTDGSWP